MLKKILHFIPLPWILVIVLASLFFGFSLSPNPEVVEKINEDSSGFPQFYMKDVITTEFDADGKLRYQLTTPSISHYQLNLNTPDDKDYTLIDKPELVFHQDQQAPWSIRADEGRSEQNGSLIHLINNVVISQQSLEQGLIKITTEYLLTRPLQQFVETDKAVKIIANQTQIDAIGMSANLETSRFQLNSKVTAAYEPRP